MNRQQRRASERAQTKRVQAADRQLRRTDELREVEAAALDPMRDPGLQRMWHSTRYIVEQWAPPKQGADVVACRLTVLPMRAGVDLLDADLQAVKRALGFGEVDAIEAFPCDVDRDAVPAGRHLWVLTGPLPFIWRAA